MITKRFLWGINITEAYNTNRNQLVEGRVLKSDKTHVEAQDGTECSVSEGLRKLALPGHVQ